MNATPKTLALQVRNAQAAKAEQKRLAHMAGTRVAFTSETGVTRPKKQISQEMYEDYCFVCGRCTDHTGEHDDIDGVKYEYRSESYTSETEYEIITTTWHYSHVISPGMRDNY